MVIGTGGTIASSGVGAVDLHNYSVSSTVQEILASVPEVAGLAELTSDQPVNVDSFKIDNPILLAIARSVMAAVANTQIDAVVVTHGTDTLEETAYFLHLAVRTVKPIVVVGAMRPANALSADGPLNLYNALLIATSHASSGKGVLIVANNHVFGARDLAKRDTSAIGAIEGMKYGILAEISGDRVDFTHSPAKPHTAHSEFDLAQVEALPDVDIMFDHQGAGDHLYRASIEAGAKAIVVAGMGNGSLSAGARQGALLAHQIGTPFLRASRTGQGIVAPLKSDVALGIIAGSSLTPQKARILAMLAIAHRKSGDDLQAIFDRY
jgi:L-asparaginase